VIPGTIFDEVTCIIHETPYTVYTPTLRKDKASVINAREMYAWRDACTALAKNLYKYPTGEDFFGAFWRTLICAGPEASQEFEFAYPGKGRVIRVLHRDFRNS